MRQQAPMLSVLAHPMMLQLLGARLSWLSSS
jgi:hypothetical protein